MIVLVTFFPKGLTLWCENQIFLIGLIFTIQAILSWTAEVTEGFQMGLNFNLFFRYEEQQMDRYQMAKLEHHRVYPFLDGTLDKLTFSPVSLLGRQ